jgi:hypothetical protein
VSQAQANDGISSLREPLRRIDSVLNFARKLVRETGGVPPGLLADFTEARKELEKAFVFNYSAVDEQMQKLLREFLQLTKGLTAQQIGEHVDRLSKRARSTLNHLMIHGEGQITLTDEIGKVRFTDEELLVEPPEQTPSAAWCWQQRFSARGLAIVVPTTRPTMSRATSRRSTSP